MNDQSYLKSIYSQVLQGFTKIQLNSSIVVPPSGGSFVYFKHLTPIDYSIIDLQSYDFYNDAIKKGVPNRLEKIELLKNEEIWPNEVESRIDQLKDIVQRQKNSLKRLKIPSQIEILQKELKKNNAEINKLQLELETLIGYTAETYSRSKINEIYTYYCCYKDNDLNELLFTEEEFGDLSDGQLSHIVNLYNDNMEKFNSANLKKIAIADFFTSYFSICQDYPTEFYGKPVCQLSNFQAELFVFGIHYKSIMNRYDDIPDDVLKDPDKLSDFHEMKEGAQKNAQNLGVDTEKNYSIVGAKKEDYKKMGLDDNGINLSKLARERGKNFNMQEIIEMTHGKNALK